jgi:hypothetical protein
MIWLTWRQHRIAAFGILLLLAGVGACLLLTGLPMYAAFQDQGVAGCIGQTSTACGDVLLQFSDQFSGLGRELIPFLNLVPALLGMFVGAPLIARELEQGTYKLIWTQAASRRRWLAVKLGLLLALSVAVALVFTAMMTWWRWPLDQIEGHFAPYVFDFEGPVVTAYAMFAFALGLAAGVVLRRTVPAIAVTLAGFLAVRLPLELLVRPRYQSPLTLVGDPVAMGKQPGVAGQGSWIVDGGIQDTAGHRLGDPEFIALARAARAASEDWPRYLHDHGYLRWIAYQPASRLATFQAMETAIFAALAVLLIGLTVVWFRRRVA